MEMVLGENRLKIIKNTEGIYNVEPRSRCSKFCINLYICRCHFTLINYLFNEVYG